MNDGSPLGFEQFVMHHICAIQTDSIAYEIQDTVEEHGDCRWCETAFQPEEIPMIRSLPDYAPELPPLTAALHAHCAAAFDLEMNELFAGDFARLCSLGGKRKMT